MATRDHGLLDLTQPPARRLRAGRATGARAGLVVGLAAASALAFLPAGTGAAAPPPSLTEVQARVDALDLQVDQAVEDYQQAQVALEDLRNRAAAAQADVQRQQQALEALQAAVGDVVASAYRNGGSTAGLELLTTATSPQAYLDKATSLDHIASDQAERLAAVQTARQRLAKAQEQAEADVAAQQQVEQTAAERKASIEQDLAASQALLGSLQEQERQALAAAQAAQAAQDAARSVQAAAAQPAAAAAGAPVATAGPVSGRAGIAVQEAYNKLGSPYVWGASGPSTFDCSGLTSWVWAKAGVSLPHSSRAQYAGLPKVPQSQVQPGDLVFYGSPIHHVGIYVGGGNMISAPHTGDVVKVQPAFRSDFVGAARP